jgi:dihydroorotate dehydrogenase (fumarate)
MKLTTNYLGLELKNPFIAGASLMSQSLDGLKELEDGGASAIVLHSLFEEQITNQHGGMQAYIEDAGRGFAEVNSFFPSTFDFSHGPDQYLEHIRKAKETLGVPVIASINGIYEGTWMDYAKWMEDAGADALELNLYMVPTSGLESSFELEVRMLNIISHVVNHIKIPVAVKISPYISSLAHFARRVEQEGAKALVLFNRFYQPDIDIENLEMKSKLELSNSSELLLRLRWASVLSSNSDNLQLSVSGGIHSVEDAVKALMCGADSLQIVSCLLQRGKDYTQILVDALRLWLQENEYNSLEQLRGSMSYRNCPEPEVIERANYMKVLQSFKV